MDILKKTVGKWLGASKRGIRGERIKILSFCLPHAKWLHVSLHDPPIFNSVIKNLITIVQRVSSRMFKIYLWSVTCACPVELKSSCWLQARNELNEYIYDEYFSKFKSSIYFFVIYISKR